jgi:hypothetical protein
MKITLKDVFQVDEKVEQVTLASRNSHREALKLIWAWAKEDAIDFQVFNRLLNVLFHG